MREHLLSGIDRTEAFSTDVLAIAATLLVLDLRVPVHDTVHTSPATALTQQGWCTWRITCVAYTTEH